MECSELLGRGGTELCQKAGYAAGGAPGSSVHRRALAHARLGEIKPLGPKSRPVGGEVNRWSRRLLPRFVWEEDQLLSVAMVRTAR